LPPVIKCEAHDTRTVEGDIATALQTIFIIEHHTSGLVAAMHAPSVVDRIREIPSKAGTHRSGVIDDDQFAHSDRIYGGRHRWIGLAA